MIKVCHLTSVHSSNDVRIFYKECASLAKAGYEVFLVAPGESREEKGVHIIGVGEKPKKRFQRMTTYAHKIYKQALELNCAIYHFHDPELLPYGLKLKRRGKKVIFDSHEYYGMQIYGKYYLPLLTRYIVSKVYMAYEKYVCNRIDAVVQVCTVSEVDIFKERAKRSIMLTNVPILSSTQFQQIAKDKSELNIPLRIVCAGSLSYARGISVLAQAAYETGSILVLCGTFSPPNYKDEILNSPYGDSIEYLGQLPHAQLKQVFLASDVGAGLGLNVGQYALLDTLATKIYEYMSYGLPLLISDFPYPKQILDEYKCGVFVDTSSVEDVKRGIFYLREHPDEARKMGQNGRRAVEETFNWGTEEKKLLSLYTDLVETNQSI